jgi:diadenosine tetraphosphate (Ap4A) HIT family hydrolase
MGSQDSVFSRIIAGSLPARAVYADDDVVAFLSIAPLAPGHTLVVPRAQVDHWEGIDPALWAQLSTVAQRIGQALRTAFDPTRVGIVVAGFEVPHVHVHVFPADDMGTFDFARAGSLPDDRMDDAAARIRAALGDAAATSF